MRTPDCTGNGVRAWKIAKPDPLPYPDWDAGCGTWLVNCTWAHPAWSWWSMGCIHLRPIEGVKPAHKQYAEAEYEIIIYAIDPHSCPAPNPDDPGAGYPALSPLDLVYQFHGVDDRDAGRILESCVRAIAAGRMSPDQDYRAAWRILLDGTVAHFRAGGHVEH